METPGYVEVTIFGEKYKLISTYKDQERISKIANLVDDRMENLSKRFPSYSKAKIAILTSLNMADELFKLYSDQDKIKDKVKNMIQLIEKSVPSNFK